MNGRSQAVSPLPERAPGQRPARTFDFEAPQGAGVRRGLESPATPPAWQLSVFSGRLGEISAAHNGAALTMAFRLVLEAQQRGEPVAWIAVERGVFYPPDVAATGIDLSALAVIQAGAILPAAKAADHLLRSGGFGLVVLDCGAAVQLPSQKRLFYE